jgi:lipoprotein-releasing system permease protein
MLLDHQMFLGQVITIATIKPESSEPVEETFLVAGAFKTGDYDADSRAVYVHVDTLKNILDLFDPEENTYGYSGIRVKVEDISRLDETIKNIEAGLKKHRGLRALSWEQLRGTLLTAVKIEKFVIYFLLVLLMSFTGLMVLLMLLLTVIEKTRDMGVLLALGATPTGVTRIFLAGGLVTCLAGTVLGLLLGYLFCWNINTIHDWVFALTGRELFAARIYHMDRIHITFQLGDVLLSVAPPVVLGFLASLVPAIWASRRDPIKAIHYE